MKKFLKIQKNKNQKGQAILIVVIMCTIVFLTIILGVTNPLVNELRLSSDLLKSKASLYKAESGADDAFYRVKNKMISNASYFETKLSVSGDDGIKTINADGEIQGIFRNIQTQIVTGIGKHFYYVADAGVGGLSLSNGAILNGNIFSEGIVSTTDGSLINGKVYNTNNQKISQDISISDSNISSWKNTAFAGSVHEGDYHVGSSGAILGPIKITGNLLIDEGGILTVSGTIWIKGNLVLNNGAKLKLSSKYGESSGIVIVDGAVSSNDGSSFEGSGKVGSYPVIVTTKVGGVAIDVSGSESAVVLVAKSGTINVFGGSNKGVLIGKTIVLDQSAVFDYDNNLANFNLAEDLSGGEWYLLDWKEVQ